jgi:thioesterase domain-containing protein/acyl carrier protein
MRAVWQRCEIGWGAPPDGVFHLAGTYHECGLADETAAGLRAAFQSKAGGAEVIGELVSAHPDTHVVLFSSLLGYFGGFQTGAYAAANHVLESFTWQQRQRGHRNVRCLLWSSWADRGMSRGLGDNVALRAKGFLALSPELGWDALVGILETTAPVVLIGLDARNPQIAAHLSTEASARTAATVTGEAQIFCDRTARVEPRDEVERKLVSIWKTLLKVPEVGVRDSFFELGGRSLLAARLFAKINQEFGQNLPLATLFTFSTIEQLATLLKGAPSAASSGPRVITLQANGSQAPLFCIPGRDANNLVYRDLVRPLGKDQPIYSLQADDPADAEARARPLLIGPCAERLVAQIRATRATGPYRISGHGFGAVLAWVVAQRLGAEVAQLVLLAPPPAAFFAPLGEPGGAPEARSVVFTTPPQPSLLRLLFAPLLGADRSAIGRDWREGRARYGELTLHSLSIPVTVFGFPENALPWRVLAPAGFSLHEEETLGAVLPALLARAPVRPQPASGRVAASAYASAFVGPRAQTAAAAPPPQPATAEPSLASRTACLLPIRKHGDAHPFFCIPGSGSDAIVFQDIATALGDNHPVYGLQARGLDARPVEGELPSVEDVAADFIAAIRAVQPSGPYHLGGHCFGCLLAWEVAGQLRAQGEEVGVLALLDPIVSNVFSDGILGRDRVGYHLGKFHRLSAGDKLRYFTAKVRNFSRTLIVRRRLGQSYAMAREMHARYTLKTYDLPVVVFLAQDSFFKLAPERDPRRHFEKICPRGVRYQEAEGDHHAILHPPGVAQVAAGLRPEISARN